MWWSQIIKFKLKVRYCNNSSRLLFSKVSNTSVINLSSSDWGCSVVYFIAAAAVLGSLLCKARSQSRGRAQLYPVTESIPASFTPEITGPLGAGIKLLRAEIKTFGSFAFSRQTCPRFVSFENLPTWSAKTLKRCRAHKWVIFERIILRTKWWIFLDMWMQKMPNASIGTCSV